MSSPSISVKSPNIARCSSSCLICCSISLSVDVSIFLRACVLVSMRKWRNKNAKGRNNKAVRLNRDCGFLESWNKVKHLAGEESYTGQNIRWRNDKIPRQIIPGAGAGEIQAQKFHFALILPEEDTNRPCSSVALCRDFQS